MISAKQNIWVDSGIIFRYYMERQSILKKCFGISR